MKNTEISNEIKVITVKDWNKAVKKAEEACKGIPESHNRVYAKRYSVELQKALESLPNRSEGKVVAYVCTRSCNLGTTKWSDCYRETCKYSIDNRDEKPKNTKNTFDGVSKSNIICFIK